MTADEQPEPDRPTPPEDEPQPVPAEPPDPRAIFEPTEEFKTKIASMLRDVPATSYDTPVSDDPADLRRDTARMAWQASLEAGYVTQLASITLDDLDPDQKPTVLRRYVNGIESAAKVLNLVIAGRVGSGKTAAAIAAGHAAVEQGMFARFIRHSQYLALLRPEGSPTGMPDWQIRRRFRDADLLILDDLGAGLDTDKEASRFVVDETLGLLGDRISAGKATITTTNEKSEALTVMFTERVLSRLSERGLLVTLKHADRRGRLQW